MLVAGPGRAGGAEIRGGRTIDLMPTLCRLTGLDAGRVDGRVLEDVLACAIRQGARPAGAAVVVVGGGIIGCSIAYHLTAAGCRDVVLVEKGELTSGTTFHSVGLVSQFRTSPADMLLMTDSIRLYREIAAEVGEARLATGREPPARLERRDAPGASAKREPGPGPRARRRHHHARPRRSGSARS